MFGAAGAAALVVSALAAAGATARVDTAAQSQAASSCQLGNGVQHVINIVFDNVHFARDNPNVPSDLEQMPHLLNFLKQNGTVFSNIAHADDRPHRRRQPDDLHRPVRRPARPAAVEHVQDLQPGRLDRSGDVVHVLDVAGHRHEDQPAGRGHDTAPSMVYSDTVPASGGRTGSRRRRGCRSPAPAARSATSRPRTWCSRTRPSTSRPCSAPTRPRRRRQRANTAIPSRTSRSPSTSARRSTAPRAHRSARARPARRVDGPCCRPSRAATTATRRCSARSTSRRRSAAARTVPQRLPGHRREREPRRPQRQHARRSRSAHTPGFPGFSPTATQSLAVLADMQEAGIPVTYGYISDLHEKKADTTTGCTTTANAAVARRPVGPGDSCYVTNAQHYDRRSRRSSSGSRRRHHAGEHAVRDQRRGERPVRRRERRPGDAADAGRLRRRHRRRATTRRVRSASCRRTSRACSPARREREHAVRHRAAGRVDLRPRPAGGERPDGPPARARHRRDDQPARPVHRRRQREDHEVPGGRARAAGAAHADVRIRCARRRTRSSRSRTTSSRRRARTSASTAASPTTTATTARTSTSPGSAWPARASRCNGVDGPEAGRRQPAAAIPSRRNTVPQASQVGTWVEETDIRPTMLYLLGLHDDYQSDGHVITQALLACRSRCRRRGARCGYDQINSSVGQFATDTLIADSKALASGSAPTTPPTRRSRRRLQLADDRDTAARR